MIKYLLSLLITFLSFSQLWANRGDIISYEIIRDWNQTEAPQNYWNIISGLVPSQSRDSFQIEFIGLMNQLTQNKRIVSYRVVYQTIDYSGNPTSASGLVILPIDNYKKCQLPIFYYGHGTTFERYSVPSRPDAWGVESFFAYFPAALNFISVAPDYYGLGDGPGFHHHNSAGTNATSGIDLIRAARSLALREGLTYNSQVFVSGYSEGGHNAMGILKKVYDGNLRSEFNIISAGCGSGAYDMSGLSYEYIINNPYYPTRSYILYLIATCEDIYGNLIREDLGETISTYLKSPYDSLYLKHLLGQDGNMGWVPLPWTQLFNPGIIQSVESNSNHPLRQCLKQNNLYDWPNPFRTSLYYVKTDEQVFWKNAPKAKLAQWKYIPWYRFWDKARIATHDMTDRGRVPDHFQGAIPIMLHYMIYTNSAKIMSCGDSTERLSFTPESYQVNFDGTIQISGNGFYKLKSATSVSFSDFKTSPLTLTYDIESNSYKIKFPTLETGAYILKLTDISGNSYYKSVVYTQPDFLEDSQYNPIIKDDESNYLLDLSLLQDKIISINLYTQNKTLIKTIKDPYVFQQLLSKDEIDIGDYVVEIISENMRYYLRFQIDNNFKTKFKIYPNPFTDEIIIENNDVKSKVEFYSIEGKIINLPQERLKDKLYLKTSTLSPGLYLLRITSDGQSQTQKIVKE